MIKEAISKVSNRVDLTKDEMNAVFYEIMGGQASSKDMKAFLVSLAEKGETIDEITQAVMVMMDKMVKIDLAYDVILDTCGTGGGSSSFNVSTMVALICAGAGVKVAKHGNRSFTSHCGSADILEKLGVKIDIDPKDVPGCIKEVGMGFLFAPLYHSAMKHVMGVRRELKRRTIFNILGPLSNPAGANAQLIGAFDEKLTAPLASVLKNLGSRTAFVVYGLDGFDEVSISAETVVSELKEGKVETYKISPEDFGIGRSKKNAVASLDLESNVKIFKEVLSGKEGPKRNMALVNASLALIAGGAAKDLKDGVKVAADSIDTGRAKATLKKLIEFTNR